MLLRWLSHLYNRDKKGLPGLNWNSEEELLINIPMIAIIIIITIIIGIIIFDITIIIITINNWAL